MKTNRKKIENELYQIFGEVFDNERDKDKAIKESKIAYSIVKQDALYRSIQNKNNE
jgi:hypothetical protein